MATISVRPGTLSPQVSFERSFYGESDERQVDIVIDIWTDITGLNFRAMPREWKIVGAAGELYVWVSVVHPLNNRVDVTLFWPKNND